MCKKNIYRKPFIVRAWTCCENRRDVVGNGSKLGLVCPFERAYLATLDPDVVDGPLQIHYYRMGASGSTVITNCAIYEA